MRIEKQQDLNKKLVKFKSEESNSTSNELGGFQSGNVSLFNVICAATDLRTMSGGGIKAMHQWLLE
jgi:hypothetical protein